MNLNNHEKVNLFNNEPQFEQESLINSQNHSGKLSKVKEFEKTYINSKFFHIGTRNLNLIREFQ